MVNNWEALTINALKTKNKIETSAFKAIKDAIKMWSTAKENVNHQLTDAIEINILKKLKAQYDDAAIQCNDGKHDELVKENKMISDVIARFLPAQVSEADIRTCVERIINEGVAPVKSNMGTIIKRAKETLMNVDGKTLSTIVASYMQ